MNSPEPLLTTTTGLLGGPKRMPRLAKATVVAVAVLVTTRSAVTD